MEEVFLINEPVMSTSTTATTAAVSGSSSTSSCSSDRGSMPASPSHLSYENHSSEQHLHSKNGIASPVFAPLSPALSDSLDSLDGAHASEPHTLTNMLLPLHVARVTNVSIVNLARFTDSRVVKLGNSLNGRVVRDQLGMLSHADAELTLELVESVPKHRVVVSMSDGIDISSKHTFISLGHTTDENVLDGEPCNVYRLVVPLTRGHYSSVPLFDEFHSKNMHYVHHTIRISGADPQNRGAPCTWSVRIRVQPEEGAVEVMSVSNSLIDSQRLTEAWANFRESVRAKFTRVFLPCSRARKGTSTGSDCDHADDHDTVTQPLIATATNVSSSSSNSNSNNSSSSSSSIGANNLMPIPVFAQAIPRNASPISVPPTTASIYPHISPQAMVMMYVPAKDVSSIPGFGAFQPIPVEVQHTFSGVNIPVIHSDGISTSSSSSSSGTNIASPM